MKTNKPIIHQVKEGIIQSLQTGIKFVFKQKMLLSAISLDLFAVFFGGAVTILPAFTDQVLHATPQDLGLLRTAPAIGAVLMAFVLMAKPPAKQAGKLLLGAVIMFGVFTIAFGFCTNYLIVLCHGFAGSVAGGAPEEAAQDRLRQRACGRSRVRRGRRCRRAREVDRPWRGRCRRPCAAFSSHHAAAGTGRN